MSISYLKKPPPPYTWIPIFSKDSLYTDRDLTKSNFFKL